jgi:acetyl-CoA C-acetyltransferase
MGQVLQAGQGQIPSRQAQIKAGIPKEVSSETVNKVCASGVRAAAILDTQIRAGRGRDRPSGAAWSRCRRRRTCCRRPRFGYRMGDAKALDAMVHDGLTNPFSGRQMFDEATEVGDELELTRPDLDRWALRSTSSRSRRRTRGACPRRSSR